MDRHRRILMVTFPSQGHINLSLQFAKRLIKMGIEVTLLTVFSVLNCMSKTTPNPQSLTTVGFSDGYNNGWTDRDDIEHFMSELKRCGSEAVRALITSSFYKGEPFSRAVRAFGCLHIIWKLLRVVKATNGGDCARIVGKRQAIFVGGEARAKWRVIELQRGIEETRGDSAVVFARTNAKLIEDVWKTGVRVVRNEEGIVESDEILRCIELVMRGEELRRNAKKWKDLVREAAKGGGSSDLNLKTFLEEVRE
ncbi:hypothetical protein ACSBR1_031025 [Camellia fascicularis]